MVATNISTLCFIYAFQDSASHQFAARVATVNASEWTTGVPLWITKNYAEVEDLLPYVANYLQPLSKGTELVANNLAPTAQFWTLNMRAPVAQQPRQKAPWARGALTVTGRYSGVKEQEYSFTLDEVQLALFGHGIGFLAFWVTPTGMPHLNDWLSFVYHFRRPKRHKGSLISIEMWRLPTSDASKPFCLLPKNLVPQQPARLSLEQVRDTLLGTAAVPTSAAVSPARWWRDAYVRDHLLPYAVYYVDSEPMPPAETATNDMMVQLIRIRKFFAAQHDVLPTAEEMEPTQASLLQYARNMWFSFSLTGGTFAAFDAPPKACSAKHSRPSHCRKPIFCCTCWRCNSVLP